jgi:uncharacterized protein YfbU (UPF0304 family)
MKSKIKKWSKIYYGQFGETETSVSNKLDVLMDEILADFDNWRENEKPTVVDILDISRKHIVSLRDDYPSIVSMSVLYLYDETEQ